MTGEQKYREAADWTLNMTACWSDQQAVIAGKRHMHITAAVWADYWLPVTTGVTLD